MEQLWHTYPRRAAICLAIGVSSKFTNTVSRPPNTQLRSHSALCNISLASPLQVIHWNQFLTPRTGGQFPTPLMGTIHSFVWANGKLDGSILTPSCGVKTGSRNPLGKVYFISAPCAFHLRATGDCANQVSGNAHPKSGVTSLTTVGEVWPHWAGGRATP